MVEARFFVSHLGLRLLFSSWLLAGHGLLSLFFPLPGLTLLAAESELLVPRSPAGSHVLERTEASALDFLLRGAVERDSGEIFAGLERVCPEALGEIKDIFHGVELCGHFPAAVGPEERQSTVKRYLKFFDSDLNRIRDDPPSARNRVRSESEIIALDLVLNRLYWKICTRYRKYRSLCDPALSEPDAGERKRLRDELIALCGLSAVDAVDALHADSLKSFKRWLFKLNLDTLWRGALKTDPELVWLDKYWKSVPRGRWNLMEELSAQRALPCNLYEVRNLYRVSGDGLPDGWTSAPGYPVPTASNLAQPPYNSSRVGSELRHFASIDSSLLRAAKARGCELNASELLLMCGLMQERSQRISKAFSEFMEKEKAADGHRSAAVAALRAQLESLCGADALMEVERNLGY